MELGGAGDDERPLLHLQGLTRRKPRLIPFRSNLPGNGRTQDLYDLRIARRHVLIVPSADYLLPRRAGADPRRTAILARSTRPRSGSPRRALP